ncbi:hypothetical protein [Rhodopila sp.]|uniref:hypothetical protein n=1 Tax=Rhodopila sp. TaxID=2480087 RepID=UPI003D12FB19
MRLTDALEPWHDFYTLAGTASATMVGLLFVAASVASGVFTTDRPAPLRVFLSASVFNFSSVLVACLVLLSPLQSWLLLGAAIMACGMVGLAHCGLSWRDSMRSDLLAKIDLEDRTWYLVMPIIGYLLETASGASLMLRSGQGCTALAVAVGLLLIVGIHNSWDITVWTVTRRSGS